MSTKHTPGPWMAAGPTIRKALERIEALEKAICDALPGPYYMDPPDGGDVPLAEQVSRMARDAARYRWLARKVSAHGICDGWQFGFPTAISLPAPALAMRDPEAALGQAIDAAIASPANQCDGCMQGAELRNGLHVDRYGKAFMACERERYAPSEQQEPPK